MSNQDQRDTPQQDVCPHCQLPAVMPEVCTLAIHDAIEANIARDWTLFEAGRQHGIKHADAPLPVPLPTEVEQKGYLLRGLAEFYRHKSDWNISLVNGSETEASAAARRAYLEVAEHLQALAESVLGPDKGLPGMPLTLHTETQLSDLAYLLDLLASRDAQLRALVEFARAIAATEVCRDKPADCYLDSGQTCGAHGWRVNEGDVMAARRLLALLDTPPEDR